MALEVLPLELLRLITSYLELVDICNLATSNPALNLRLLGSTSFCEELTKRHIPYSKEADLASRGVISYRKAIVNVHQRRTAYTHCRPYKLYSANASDFIYHDSTLCFLSANRVHVLSSQPAERPVCLNLDSVFSPHSDQAHFRLVHYHSRILTVRVRTARGRKLAFFDVGQIHDGTARPLLMLSVPSSRIEVVRNDSRYLAIGIYRAISPGLSPTWEFYVYDLRNLQQPRLPFNHYGRFGSTELGSNLVIEVFDGILWIISSQVTEDPEGLNPTGYYGGCRVALDFNHSQLGSEEATTCEANQPKGLQPAYFRLWRRQQVEGPIHDSWSTLSFSRCEAAVSKDSHDDRQASKSSEFSESFDVDDAGQRDVTEQVPYMVTETRSEWQPSVANPLRSYYTTVFDIDSCESATNEKPGDAHMAPLNRLARYSKYGDLDDHVETMLSEVPRIRIDTFIGHREWWPERYIGYHERDPENPNSIISHRKQLQQLPEEETFRLPQILYRSFEQSSKTGVDIVLDKSSDTDLRPLLRIRTSATPSNNLFPRRETALTDATRRLFSPPSFDQRFRAFSDQSLVVFGAKPRLHESAEVVIISFDPLIDLYACKLSALNLREARDPCPSDLAGQTVRGEHLAEKEKMSMPTIEPDTLSDFELDGMGDDSISHPSGLGQFQPIMGENPFMIEERDDGLTSGYNVERSKSKGTSPALSDTSSYARSCLGLNIG